MFSGLRRKSKAVSARQRSEKVFVDLENYDIDGDTTVFKIRVLEVTDPADVSPVKGQMSKGAVLFINLSKFVGTDAEMIEMKESIKTAAHENNCQLFSMNDVSVLAAPAGVKVDKVRVRRKATE